MFLRKSNPVLQLDVQGMPQSWVSLEQAAIQTCTDSIAWVDGDGPLAVLRGGLNALSGQRSCIAVYPIIALRGASRVNLFEVIPAVTKPTLLARDRHTCAYCGLRFAARDLQCEHIVPAHGAAALAG